VAPIRIPILTPDLIAKFADRQKLAPTHDEPWRKILIAGSDDHAGIFPASAYTEAPTSENVVQFLRYIERGDCVVRGPGGNSPGHRARSV